MLAAMDALAELRALAAHAENRRTETGLPRVAMVRGRVPEHELTGVYEPMINLIVQGKKTMTIGDRTLRYDPATYFVMAVDLPAIGRVHPGPGGQPYLAVSLTLDPRVVAEVLETMPPGDDRGPGFAVAAVTPELLDAWVRLMRLTRRPDEAATLAPLYEREILFRVLQGPEGHVLRDIAVPGSAIARVRRAVAWIRQHHDRPVHVPTLARLASMSETTFHRHFRAATAMSPLQFQKRLRLMRARSLLIEELTTAAAVAFEVGYESASQFNREYARFFGRPPATDARLVRERLRPPLPPSPL